MAAIIKFVQQNIYPTNYIHIGNVFKDYFEYLKIYIFRLEYSLDDYERRQIPRSYQTFRTTIWITLNSWINIFFTFHLAQYPSYFILKILKSFEQLFHFERVDLLFQFQISIFLILEYLCFGFFQKILHYNFPTNNVIRKYCYYFNDNQLKLKYRQNFTRYIHIYHIISTIIIRIMFIILILSGIYGIFTFISVFINDDITFIVMIFYIMLLINLLLRSHYLIIQILDLYRYSLYLIQLLKLQILQIILQLRLLNQFVRFNSKIYRQFIRKYNIINQDVIIFNQMISVFFFCMEIGSKIMIVYCSIFLSKQIEMNLFNTSLIIYIISALIATNILYLKASHLPHYNRRGCLSIMNWLARLQYQQQQQQLNNNGHNRNILQSLSIRNTIRLNRFAQSMSDNHLGFSCGQMFIITKYKFIEIFLMNFVLVILFYKKICLA